MLRSSRKIVVREQVLAPSTSGIGASPFREELGEDGFGAYAGGRIGECTPAGRRRSQWASRPGPWLPAAFAAKLPPQLCVQPGWLEKEAGVEPLRGVPVAGHGLRRDRQGCRSPGK